MALETDSLASQNSQINAIIEAPPPQFIFFYFLLQIRRSLRLSVCAFYIRVEALYTLKHHPAESVTSDFFIADPIIAEEDYKFARTHTFALLTMVIALCTIKHL